MTATVKTVETKTNFYGDSFVITTWTIGDHTLHQVVDSYGEANWNAKTLTKNAPDLYTLPNWDNPGVVEYGVNWPGDGHQDPCGSPRVRGQANCRRARRRGVHQDPQRPRLIPNPNNRRRPDRLTSRLRHSPTATAQEPPRGG